MWLKFLNDFAANTPENLKILHIAIDKEIAM